MKKMTGRLLAALCAIVVMLSFSTVIFAEEADTTLESTVDTTADTSVDTEKAESEDEADATNTETTGTVTGSEEEKDNSLLWSGIITLIIIVVVVICVLVWALKDKERALKTWRSFKSEFKKVVWAEKHETLKNTILVIVACVVIAAVLGLVDYLFSLGVVGLGNLI